MSTWISRTGVALAAGLALAACQPGGFGAPAAVTRAMTVSDGAVMVAGPQGYCIDRGASRDGPEGAFVLFGTCAALAGSRAAGQPSQPVVLTVSVLPGAPEEGALSENFEALARFFRSAPGRAALSRSGEAEAVSVEEIAAAGEVLYLRLHDSSASEGQAVEPEYWRAILALDGRIVTLSALGLKDRPQTSGEKRRALKALVAKIRAANSGGDVS